MKKKNDSESISEEVMRLLLDVPDARDDDRLLVSIIWGREGFTLKKYQEGKHVNHDVITRTRRKLQEVNPCLRGKKWKARHGNAIYF